MNIVPRLWPESTIICIGGGPSLTQEDVDAVRGHGRVIAVNDAYKLAPWCDVLYAADAKWWNWHEGVPSFTGWKYSVDGAPPVTWPNVRILKLTGPDGLETQRYGLRSGLNSGYQAINLAVHLGARRILLLGYDMAPAVDGRAHWFGDHPDKTPSPYPQMRAAFDTLVEPLAALGIEVVNCSRQTALLTFPCRPLDSVLNGDDVLRYLAQVSEMAKSERPLGRVEAIS